MLWLVEVSGTRIQLWKMAKEESRGSVETLEMQDMYISHKFCSECVEFSI